MTTSFWQPMNTAPRDGTNILLSTLQGYVNARFVRGEINERGYSPPCWICYGGDDEEWEIDVEETRLDNGTMEYNADGVLDWMPIPL